MMVHVNRQLTSWCNDTIIAPSRWTAALRRTAFSEMTPKSKIEPIYLVIGRNIQRTRDARAMSQAALGASLSPPLTRAAIANMEGGKQRILVHTLLSIARNLLVPLGELLVNTDHREVPTSVSADIKDVRKDLLQHFSQATADRVIGRMAKEQSHEPPIRPQSRGKNTRKPSQ